MNYNAIYYNGATYNFGQVATYNNAINYLAAGDYTLAEVAVNRWANNLDADVFYVDVYNNPGGASPAGAITIEKITVWTRKLF